MTRKWSNVNLPGALHFITGNIRDRTPIFRNETCCKLFYATFNELRTNWPARLIAHVLMPDHFHLIANPKDGKIKEFAGALKAKLAHKIIKETGDLFGLPTPAHDGSTHQVWQESFKASPLWSGWMIWQKINYIHANPVKAKLVKSAKDYQWSSFGAFYQNEKDPIIVDQDWWWADDSEKLSKAMKELGWLTYHKRTGKD